MAHGVRPGAVIMFVRNLDHSVIFYRELLGLDVVDSSSTAALLVNDAGLELVLRAMGGNAQRALGDIGVQYVAWTVPTREDLDRCEQLLREHSAYRQSRTEGEVAAVEGTDPDGIPVIIAYRGAHEPRLDKLPTRIYAW